MPNAGPFHTDSNDEPDRAVVLLGPDSEVPGDFEEALDSPGTLFEVVRHPLLAAAELVRLERDVRRSGSSSRTTFWVVGREIDDLEHFFQRLRAYLPRVSARVLVQRERLTVFDGVPEPAVQTEGPAWPEPERAPTGRRPTLRYTGDALEPAGMPEGPSPTRSTDDAAAPDDGPRHEHDEDPPGPSGSAVTREEIEMLLSMFDDEPPLGPPHDPEPSP